MKFRTHGRRMQTKGYPVKFRKYYSLGTMREMKDDKNYPGVSFSKVYVYGF